MDDFTIKISESPICTDIYDFLKHLLRHKISKIQFVYILI